MQLRSRISSVADISDGLFKDVRHVLAPGCAATLWADKIPRLASLTCALAGGEDFELVCTVPRAQLRSVIDLGCTHVGEVVKGRGVRVLDKQGKLLPMAGGFDHFSNKLIENNLSTF
jgi:thiamine monophosphate kinase